MKTIYSIGFWMASIVITCCQGTLVIDQQASTGNLARGGSFIQSQQPMGQSFTPSLSAIGFVQFRFTDTSGNLGSSIYVNLLENSITGSLVAATSAVFMPSGFAGITNFFFSSNIPIQSGIEYFFVPVLASGNNTAIMSDVFNYSGGTAYFSGSPSTSGLDFWFREGIVVVPEPTSGGFLLTAVSVFLLLHKRRGIFTDER